MWRAVELVVIAYLLGSLPSAYILTRLATGQDVRRIGDGNMGARNVWIQVSPVAGLLTLALDVAKGATAAYLTQLWDAQTLVLYLAALAMLLGHGFPVWLRGRGGKGLAAVTGFVLVLWPLATLIGMAILVVAHLLRVNDELAIAFAVVAAIVIFILQGGGLEAVLFVAACFCAAGLKKLVDLPYERSIQASSAQSQE